MKTCATCLCWHKTGTSPVARRIVNDTGVRVIPPGDEGQCHGLPPREDFRWPLTSAGDWCFQHRSAQPPPPPPTPAPPPIPAAPEPPTTTLEAGTPGAASPATADLLAGTEATAADDTGNRRPKRSTRAPKA